jgi:methylenetetrahydrofolate dehydrogenase (NADP+)/methenyltetrahydrofolate cyclohydrolase
MPARIIDGVACAASLSARVSAEATHLQNTRGVTPTLAVVLVGDNPASRVYVKSKSRQAAAAGIAAIDRRLPATASGTELLALIRQLNADRGVHGILVQLPLPDHIRAAEILRAIDPSKDVDGFHPVNVGLLASGAAGHGFVPCTPLGCLFLVREARTELEGLNAVILGRSTIVGRPMAQLLLGENCTVTVAHSRTTDLAEHCRRADIVVAAIGKPSFVRAGWIKPGATVIDVGINRVVQPDGTPALVGDVDQDDVRAVAGAMTPVPGGVGPMTIACLLANTIIAACRLTGIPTRLWNDLEPATRLLRRV